MSEYNHSTYALNKIIVNQSDHYRVLKISDLCPDGLLSLSNEMSLSLSKEDMISIQDLYNNWSRDPTDVELEVIAQTWSEHCKHRIFGANIIHEENGTKQEIKSLFKTFIYDVSQDIFKNKTGFVLSAFHDNAGFIKLDENQSVCLKVETHNHPSAIEPYAGSNTGLGGVIRDILGAGKGSKPIASLDVFCFGPPETDHNNIDNEDVIHPLGVMRGVVKGVRDYGNRMGIPTVSGAVQFDDCYIYNPLVFCGTLGVIPIKDIDKSVEAGMKIIAVGGRTGRDGIHGATFSSSSLDNTSHKEDQQAVQIGNPIEEKKLSNFILSARENNLIKSITDCGAGGFSSACGEMLEECGGVINLDSVLLKESGLVSWEIFISESQERMVLAVDESDMDQLNELAKIHETELIELGESDGSGILKVVHKNNTVCHLNCSQLHDVPILNLKSKSDDPISIITSSIKLPNLDNLNNNNKMLCSLMEDHLAISSREPIIREYDYQVQGNTVKAPLSGARGDSPEDSSIIRIEGSEKLVSLSLSLLPEWGKLDPYAMGLACVDECFRQLVISGSNPEKIAILDNFCVGNPYDEKELGSLVQTVKGISKAAQVYQAPFVSGKDSFYNYFETKKESISIPTTILISGMGIVEDKSHIVGSSLRRNDSLIVIFGNTQTGLGGSVFSRINSLSPTVVPRVNLEESRELYSKVYEAIEENLILSAHDISEGGFSVALAEMAFSLKAGVEVDISSMPSDSNCHDLDLIFGESPSRILAEVSTQNIEKLSKLFNNFPYSCIGRTTCDHKRIVIDKGYKHYINKSAKTLKFLWKNSLKQYY